MDRVWIPSGRREGQEPQQLSRGDNPDGLNSRDAGLVQVGLSLAILTLQWVGRKIGWNKSVFD